MTKETYHQLLFAWWREAGRVLAWREKEGGSGEVLGDSEGEGKWENRKIGVGAAHGQPVREATFATYFAGDLRRDPYRVIVSEVMLQQTQVERVKQKYQAWMKKWPTIEDLANATLAEVLIEWQGLGYNRRARFLWLLAKEIVENRKGKWPTDEKELLKLPGIGRYTARAVMSFAFGKQVGVVDVNVKRVFGRWFDINFQVPNSNFQKTHQKIIPQEKLEIDKWKLEILEKDLIEIKSEKDWFTLADKLLPSRNADPWNQALMDFGALVCTARNPKCESCPMFAVCAVNVRAREEGYESYREHLAQWERTSSERIANPIREGKVGESDNGKMGEKENGKSEKKGKDFGLKFEQTDRFFRGRIIDTLREKVLNYEDLLEILDTKFNLHDSERFEKLISSLQKEGMIEKVGEVVKLGK